MVDPVAAGSSAFNQAFGAGMSVIKGFQQQEQFKQAQQLKQDQFENTQKQQRLANGIALIRLLEDPNTGSETLSLAADFFAEHDAGLDPKGPIFARFNKLARSKDPNDRKVASALAVAAVKDPERVKAFEKAITTAGGGSQLAQITGVINDIIRGAPSGQEQTNIETAAKATAGVAAGTAARADTTEGRLAGAQAFKEKQDVAKAKRARLEGAGAVQFTQSFGPFKKGQRLAASFNKDTQRFEVSTSKGIVSVPQSAVVPAKLEGIVKGALSQKGRIAERVTLGTELAKLNFITNARQETIALPENAFGLRGNIAREGGRLFRALGSLFDSPEIGEKFAKQVGGASLKQMRRLGVQFRAQIAKSISEITGEQSGRISEAERELTTKALGLLSSLADKGDVMEVQFLSQQLSLMKIQRIAHEQNPTAPLPFSVKSREDIAKTLSVLLNRTKMTPEEAQATIVLLNRQENFLGLITDTLGR